MAETKKVAVPSIDSAETSAKYDGYTGVRIIVGTNDDGKQAECFAGSEDGRVLEVTNPFGTEQMAKDILKTVQGFKYQPLKVSGAMLNPAAEIGDGISANGVYSGIFKRYTTFGRLMKSDVEAPSEEEIDHEYAYETKENREYSRFVASTKSSLKINSDSIEAEVERAKGAEGTIKSTLTQHADAIEARVTQTGSDDNGSFSWSLTKDGFILKSNNTEVFKADESGITVTGEIKATSGYIGSESSGFKITGSAIYNNMTSMSSTTTPGIYIGTDGISLGGGEFKVTSSGALYATTGTFTGTVYAGSIAYGGDCGTMDGGAVTMGTIAGGIYGQLASKTVATGNIADTAVTEGKTSATVQETLKNVDTMWDCFEIQSGQVNEFSAGTVTATNFCITAGPYRTYTLKYATKSLQLADGGTWSAIIAYWE